MTLLCEGLCDGGTLQPVMICRESTRTKFMNIQTEYSKMRSEPSFPHGCKKSRVILIHLENNFGKYAQEVWERNWMNLDMHTMLLYTKLLNATLFNMYNPISMETFLKAS